MTLIRLTLHIIFLCVSLFTIFHVFGLVGSVMSLITPIWIFFLHRKYPSVFPLWPTIICCILSAIAIISAVTTVVLAYSKGIIYLPAFLVTWIALLSSDLVLLSVYFILRRPVREFMEGCSQA